MRLFADACIAGSLVRALRAAGYDVSYAMEGPPGLDDATILAEAYRGGRILLTEDHDFGSLTVREGRAAHGILLIELYGFSEARRNERVLSVLGLGADEIAGRFTIVEPTRTRSRPLAAP